MTKDVVDAFNTFILRNTTDDKPDKMAMRRRSEQEENIPQRTAHLVLHKWNIIIG